MPLDPFFEERLRVHRRYLIDRALTSARTRVAELWPFARDAPSPAPVAGPSRRAPAEGGRSGSRLDARARHRRAALAWDRSELRTVGTPAPDVRTSEHEVLVPGHPSVRVRIYHPESDSPTPGVLALFGGAFRIGGIDYPTTDAANRHRAVDAQVAIVAVDYALAPEHRYPVQLEQAWAALEWLFAHAPTLGIDPHRIGIAGTSAGANIAAALTLVNRDRARLPLRLQVLEVPVVDLTGGHLDLKAMRALGIPRLIVARELRSVARTYLTNAAEARQPYASPLLAASHRGLPPAVILTAEYDPLRGDGEAYAAALRRAGVDASAVRYLGVTHDAGIFTGVLPAARRWHDDIVTAMRRLHSEASHQPHSSHSPHE